MEGEEGCMRTGTERGIDHFFGLGFLFLEERELLAPDLDLVLELADLGDLRGVVAEVGLEVCELGLSVGEETLVDVDGELDGTVEYHGNLDELGLLEASAGHGGSADAQAGRNEGTSVSGDGILIRENAAQLCHSVDSRSVNTHGSEIKQQQMVVSASRDQFVAKLDQFFSENFSVALDLRLILLELRRARLEKRSRDGRNRVVMRSSLEGGEDGRVDFVFELVKELLALLIDSLESLTVEDQSTTRSTQSLVGSSRNNVRVLESRRNLLSSHETGDVGDIAHEDGVVGVSNLSHALVVVEAGVRGGTGDDELWAEDGRVLGEGIVINVSSFDIQVVRHGFEEDGGGRDALLGGHVTMGQVATVRQIQAHDAVVGCEETRVDGKVGGRTGVGLDIDAPFGGIQIEGLQRSLLAQTLVGIDMLVTAVVARTRVALRVLVHHV